MLLSPGACDKFSPHTVQFVDSRQVQRADDNEHKSRNARDDYAIVERLKIVHVAAMTGDVVER